MSQKKGILGALSAIGIVKSDGPEEGDEQSPTSTPAPSTPVPTYTPSSTAVVDQALLDQIRVKVFNIGNSAFTRYSAEKAKLAGVIKDPVQLTRAALATTTLSASDVVKALEQTHTAALSGLKSQFAVQASQHEKDEIEGRQSHIDSNTERAQEKQQQITSLQAEIAQLNLDSQGLQREIDTEKRAIADRSREVDQVIGTIAREIEIETNALKALGK